MKIGIDTPNFHGRIANMVLVDRPYYLRRLETAVRRSPITAIVGPRQCGKTTLARLFEKGKQTTHFDLESPLDARRLQNPELMLSGLDGFVVLDEIQAIPSLFNVLRVLVDRQDNPARFIILGSASPDLVKNASETLAGRVEFIELSGFNLMEAGADALKKRWLRGGFPRSFLADSDEDSVAWREGFIRTFLQRDIPQLGITIPSAAMRRFWTMLAHYHSQIWNASEFARSMGLTGKTVRSYLDILTGTFMVRQLQPWHENISKRQVKSPKIFLRDSGILHSLLSVSDDHALWGHPKVGASWEGFALEQTLQAIRPPEAFFWATHQGAEIDLFFVARGRRYGVEFKMSEAPAATRSMHIGVRDLNLKHLWIVYPGEHAYPVEENISVLPLSQIDSIAEFVN